MTYMLYRTLNLGVVTLARAVSKDSEQDHHEQRDEDNDDRDLDCCEQETNQQYQLFQQRHNHEDQRHYCSESAKTFKNAATHKIKPRKKVLGSPLEWKRINVSSPKLRSFTGAKLSCLSRPRAGNN